MSTNNDNETKYPDISVSAQEAEEKEEDQERAEGAVEKGFEQADEEKSGDDNGITKREKFRSNEKAEVLFMYHEKKLQRLLVSSNAKAYDCPDYMQFRVGGKCTALHRMTAEQLVKHNTKKGMWSSYSMPLWVLQNIARRGDGILNDASITYDDPENEDKKKAWPRSIKLGEVPGVEGPTFEWLKKELGKRHLNTQGWVPYKPTHMTHMVEAIQKYDEAKYQAKKATIQKAEKAMKKKQQEIVDEILKIRYRDDKMKDFNELIGKQAGTVVNDLQTLKEASQKSSHFTATLRASKTRAHTIPLYEIKYVQNNEPSSIGNTYAGLTIRLSRPERKTDYVLIKPETHRLKNTYFVGFTDEPLVSIRASQMRHDIEYLQVLSRHLSNVSTPNLENEDSTKLAAE